MLFKWRLVLILLELLRFAFRKWLQSSTPIIIYRKIASCDIRKADTLYSHYGVLDSGVLDSQ